MRYLDALNGNNQGRPPIWIMRQAGRYMPEYRALRAKHTFHEMTHSPELAAEITKLPIDRFGFDAAIIFSDILVISEALGRPFDFVDGVGPVLKNPVTPKTLGQLEKAASLNFVADAIAIAKESLDVPLIGFCGAPFTIASYMIEGGSSKDLKKTKQWMFSDPASFHDLLCILTDAITQHLKRQINAGCDALQVFETWSLQLGLSDLREFSFLYLKHIIHSVDAPITLFGRGTAGYIEELAALKPAALALDWSCDMTKIRKRVPKSIALQGNLDPHCLYAPPEKIAREARRLCEGMRHDPSFIFNLGHGILPDIPPENVHTLVETVKEFSCETLSSPT